MSVRFESAEADQYGSYIIPFQSKIMEKEVDLIIPAENGDIEDRQRTLVNRFEECEESLKEGVYNAIFDHYQNEVPELRRQFSATHQHLVPLIKSIEQLKKLLTPTGVYIGELEPSSEAVELLFECSWEPEHGLGVVIKNWKVDEVSHQDIVFTI